MADARYLWIGEPLTAYVDGHKNDATGAFINNATITAQVQDASGNDVGSAATLSYVASSDGDYSGTIPASTTALLSPGQRYTIVYAAAANTLARRVVMEARYRGAS